MNQLVVIQRPHCERPLLIFQPPDKDVNALLKTWWAFENLPLLPNTPQINSSPEWVDYWKRSHEANLRWRDLGLLNKMPSDYVMRWHYPFAEWLIHEHKYELARPTWLMPAPLNSLH